MTLIPPEKNGKTGWLEMLKIALACCLSGGSAAAVVGRLEARSVAASLEAHETGIHPEAAARIDAIRVEFIGQAQEAQKSAIQAQWESKYTRLMMEQLLRREGVTPVAPPPPPAPISTTDAGIDASPRDAGRRDGGRRDGGRRDGGL